MERLSAHGKLFHPAGESPTRKHGGFLVRPATPADSEGISSLDTSQSPAWQYKQGAGDWNNPFHWHYVAVSPWSGEIIGYIHGQAIQEEGEIHNIVVGKNWQRQGGGQTLLVNAMKRLEKSGVRKCFLEVRRSNTGAMHLYRKNHFHEVGLRKKYYGNPVEDAVIMEWKHTGINLVTLGVKEELCEKH